MSGKIIAICTSEKKGTQKKEIDSANIVENYGIQGDAHGGSGHRQVSLLGKESIDKMRNRGIDISHGAFGENIVTEGIDLLSLPLGAKLKLGRDVFGEVTQIGKECHNPCAIYHTVGDCIMPREGIFIKILRGGSLNKGDDIVESE